MDGDDAVEFFQQLEVRFNTDMSVLWENWSDHFNPEVPPLKDHAWLIPVGVLTIIVTNLIEPPKEFEFYALVGVFPFFGFLGVSFIAVSQSEEAFLLRWGRLLMPSRRGIGQDRRFRLWRSVWRR